MKSYTFILLLIFILIAQESVAQIPSYASHRVIVQFREEVNRGTQQQITRDLLAKNVRELSISKAQIWEIPTNIRLAGTLIRNVTDYITYVQRHYPQLYIQPDYQYSISTIPDDPGFFEQWYLKNTEQNACEYGIDIGAENAWNLQRKVDSVVVGVIDTGIDWTHPDLINNIWQNLGEDTNGDGVLKFQNGFWQFDSADTNGIDDDGNGFIDDFIGWDFHDNDNNPYDEKGHGTHVSGIIGAEGNNGIGISGICWSVRLMALKFMDSTGVGYTSEATEALEYAIQMGANITNNSWGGSSVDSILYWSIEQAGQQGQLFVAAAGNDGADNDLQEVYPANYELDHIISVGAHDCEGQITDFSNFGRTNVDILAPGKGIYSTWPLNEYRFNNGTSMAAPQVSGALALTLGRFPDIDALTLKNVLLNQVKTDTSLVDFSLSGGRLFIPDILQTAFAPNGGDNAWVLYTDGEDVQDVAFQGDNVWIATGGGLVKFNRSDSSTLFFNKGNSGIPSHNLKVLTTDLWGNPWLGIDNVGISAFERNNWQNFDISHLGLGTSVNNNNTYSFTFSGIEMDTLRNIWGGVPGSFFGGSNPNTIGGLIRYDTQWKRISRDEIGKVLKDSQHNIRVVTRDRIFKFDNLAPTIIDIPDSLLFSLHHSLTNVDQNGTIWIVRGIDRETLIKFDGVNWERVTFNDSTLDGETIHQMTVDHHGKIWMIVGEQLVSFKDSAINTYNIPEIDIATANGLYADDNEKIWISLETNGLYCYDPASSIHRKLNTTNTELNNKFELIGNTLLDSEGNLWGMGSDRIYLFKKNEWYTFNHSQNPYLPINFGEISSPYRISLDSLNRLWIASDSGLVVFNEQEVFVYDSANSLLTQSVVVDDTGVVWLVDFSGKIFSIANEQWTSSNFPDSVIFNFVVTGPEGLLIGSSDLAANGIYLKNRVNNIELISDGFNWNGAIINSIVIINDSLIWAGTSQGLFKYNGVNWQIIANSPIVDISLLVADREDNLWIGSDNNIFRYKSDTWTIWNAQNSALPNANINGISYEQNGLLYINVGGELAIFDPAQSLSFSASTLISCLGDSVIFRNASSQADEYRWEIDGISIANSVNLTYSWQQAGIHEVKLIANDSLFGQREFIQYIQVRTPIDLDLGADTTLCGEAIFLEANVDADSYLWTTIEGDTLSTLDILTPIESGSYILEVIDACGFVDLDTVEVVLTKSETGACVWPGDVNANGLVNIEDFLLMAIAHDTLGIARPDTNTQWQAQESMDWASTFRLSNPLAAGLNHKHADCNGDGVVNIEEDARLIQKYTNYTYESRSEEGKAFLELAPTAHSLVLGDTLFFEINLKHPDDTIENLYGLAFQIKPNIRISQPISMDFEDSWIATNEVELQTLNLILDRKKQVDIGISRTLGLGVPDSIPNFGKVGNGGILITVDDLDDPWTRANRIFFSMDYGELMLVQPDGTPIGVNPISTQAMETVTFELPWAELDLKVFLQGAYENDSMCTDLNRLNLLPISSPYPQAHELTLKNLPTDMVDWIEVEVRSRQSPDYREVLERRPAILLKDGRIVDPITNGLLKVLAPYDSFYVVLRHRNHLAIMSDTALVVHNGKSLHDFTTGHAFGIQSMVSLDENYGMFAGDVNQDERINYITNGGDLSDREEILRKIGVHDFTHILGGYWAEDINMNGQIKYSGPENDRKIILQNLGGTNTRAKILSDVP